MYSIFHECAVLQILSKLSLNAITPVTLVPSMAMMTSRRARKRERAQSLLPLTTAHESNSCSLWYCDWKIHSFNELLFSIGHQYSRFLRVWFILGAAVSFVGLVTVAMLLIWESAATFHILSSTSHLDNLLGRLLFDTSPMVSVVNMSILDVVIMFFSTIISVAVHEFGHAIAATSEDVQVEYIAIFLAVIFPGALIALNYDLLQSLPRSASLRIYCAGIWHNVMFCAVCCMTLTVLPLLLNPFYIHGEMLTVTSVLENSPLATYLSPGDVIKSVDGLRIEYPRDWSEKMAQTHAQSLYNSVSRKGYCVPSSWLERPMTSEATDDQFSCPDDFAAFVSLQCRLNSSLVAVSSENSNGNRMIIRHCLVAKDVVKQRKCGDGWQVTGPTSKSCACMEGESCMAPVQTPGTSWVEITYSSPYASECLHARKNISANFVTPDSESSLCGGTFIFAGNALSLASSVELTAYQSRRPYLSARIPDLLEKIFSCTFHVSATLAFLNILPVYLLDGESILETALLYVTWLTPRTRRKLQRFCLAGGSILSIITLSRILYFTFSATTL